MNQKLQLIEARRTCLACRQKGDRAYMLRFVRALDGEICFDDKAVLQSRGAWLCPKQSCIEKAILRKLLFRGEKILPVDLNSFVRGIEERLGAKALACLGLMRRMGFIEVGRDAVMGLAKKDQLAAILFAHDLAERSKRLLNTKLAGNLIIPIKSPFSMDAFGNCLGRAKTGVVGLLQSRITDEALNLVNKISAFRQSGK